MPLSGDGAAARRDAGGGPERVPRCQRAGQQRSPRGARQTAGGNPAGGGGLQPQPQLRGAQRSGAGGASETQRRRRRRRQLSVDGQSACQEIYERNPSEVLFVVDCSGAKTICQPLVVQIEFKKEEDL